MELTEVRMSLRSLGVQLFAESPHGRLCSIALAKERKANEMVLNDQDKLRIAREYFMRSDQGRPDILELFH